MKLTDYNSPNTMKEAIEVLNDYFSYVNTEEKEYFNNSTSSDIVIQYHHGLGQKIRNAWLWPKDHKDAHSVSEIHKVFVNLNIKHPDDMSHFLLELFWHFKHDTSKSIEEHTEKLLNEMIIKDILE